MVKQLNKRRATVLDSFISYTDIYNVNTLYRGDTMIEFNCRVIKSDCVSQARGIKDAIGIEIYEIDDYNYLKIRHAIISQNIYKVRIEPIEEIEPLEELKEPD